MRRLPAPLLTIIGLLLVNGCTVDPDWNVLQQQAAQIRAACDSQHAAGTIKTALATEQCANPPIHKLYADAHFFDLDVIDAYLAKREAIAAQQDRKAIGPEDTRAQLAQALVDENTALQQRSTNRAVTTAASYSPLPLVCNHFGPGPLICN
jgi:hypothetical protein